MFVKFTNSEMPEIVGNYSLLCYATNQHYKKIISNSRIDLVQGPASDVLQFQGEGFGHHEFGVMCCVCGVS